MMLKSMIVKLVWWQKLFQALLKYFIRVGVYPLPNLLPPITRNPKSPVNNCAGVPSVHSNAKLT